MKKRTGFNKIRDYILEELQAAEFSDNNITDEVVEFIENIKPKEVEVFELISENLSGLGGRMGTERTTTNFREYFYNIEDAKERANTDYQKGQGKTNTGIPLRWIKNQNAGVRTEDLFYVMYYINKLKIQ